MIFKETSIRTPVGGTVSWNTCEMRGVLHCILISPASGTYDFKMIDENSIVAYSETGLSGVWRDDTPIGVYGIYTVTLSNAEDVEFKVTLLYEELRGI